MERIGLADDTEDLKIGNRSGIHRGLVLRVAEVRWDDDFYVHNLWTEVLPPAGILALVMNLRHRLSVHFLVLNGRCITSRRTSLSVQLRPMRGFESKMVLLGLGWAGVLGRVINGTVVVGEGKPMKERYDGPRRV